MDSREDLIKGRLYCPGNVQQTGAGEICEGLCGSGGDHQPRELQQHRNVSPAFTETSFHNYYKHHLCIHSIGNDTGRSAQDKVLVWKVLPVLHTQRMPVCQGTERLHQGAWLLLTKTRPS